MKFLFLFLLVISSSNLLAQSSVEIYLIRHGQTNSNLHDKSQGMHTPLNETGKQQAAAIGKSWNFFLSLRFFLRII